MMGSNVMGIIFSNMHDHLVGDLTPNRCMGSIPVGGRYRLIDFILSCFANTGIKDVGVITKTNYQSLMNHLGNGREWDLARKKGGLVVLPPYGHHDAGIYQNRIEALHGVMQYIRSSSGDYVITADCDVMMNTTFDSMFECHEEKGADITLLYKKMDLQGGIQKETTSLIVDDDGRVKDVLVNPVQPGEHNIHLQIMLISKKLLEYLVGNCYSRNLYSYERDILQTAVGNYKVYACEYTGYATRFSSMQTYFSANLAFLDEDVRRQLFPRSLPIYTNVRDAAPVRYGLAASVSNSLLANGCVVEGHVENSVIFRGVKVGKGAKIKNSVVMNNTNIGAGASLECVVADKNVIISEGRNLAGFHTYPVYISKNSVV